MWCDMDNYQTKAMKERERQSEEFDIEKLRKGDHKVFERLFKLYYEALCDYAYRLLHDREEAKDIVQDIFCMLWDKREGLNVQSSLGAYLYKTVYTRCVMSMRHQKVVREYVAQSMLDLYFQEIIQTPEAELKLRDKDLNRFIWEAVDKLPPRCREIFILSKIEHLSHQEISKRLNVSEKTIENQMTIAFERLRKDLEWLLWLILVVKTF